MINMNVSGAEYVNVLADNISSWCTSSREAMFTWRADIEQSNAIIIQLNSIPLILLYIKINNNNDNNNSNTTNQLSLRCKGKLYLCLTN
jgi:uncharacterized membrane protein